MKDIQWDLYLIFSDFEILKGFIEYLFMINL